MNRRADPTALMPPLDNEGYLLAPTDWSPALAPLLAAEAQAADVHSRRLGGAR